MSVVFSPLDPLLLLPPIVSIVGFVKYKALLFIILVAKYKTLVFPF